MALIASVLGVIAALVVASLVSSGAVASEGTAPPAAVREVTSLTTRTLVRVGGAPTLSSLHHVVGARPLVLGGKPAVLFVSEESCPYCAAERWALVVALSQFGAWHGLGATTSSPEDVYPSTATFSFRHAWFTSPFLSLRTTELADNAGRPLQPLTPLDTSLIDRFDVPPYVDGAAQSGAVPFLDIDDSYVLAGAQYNPGVLEGMSMGQIAALLAEPASPAAAAIDHAADTLVVALERVLHVAPRRR
jgi:Domain of unknown function (DUF929)